MMRWIHAALIATALVASVLTPQWTRAQAGYGYYHDLVSRLRGPLTAVPAGGSTTFDADLVNAGPETAAPPRVAISLPATAGLLATGSCVDSPAPVSPCQLPAPLAAGATTSMQFTIGIAPSERGPLVVGVQPVADGVDLNPGNDASVAVVFVEGVAALRVRLLSRQTLPGGRQSVVVLADNRGPSAVDQLRVNWQAISGGDFAGVQCLPIGQGNCPVAASSGRLAPGAALAYTFDFPPLSVEVPSMGIDVQVLADDARVVGGENTLSVRWSDPISRNGFE
jgi:hypothetical protein